MSYNLIKVRQGSQDWVDLRRNKIGASDAPDILNKSGYEGTPYKKWREKVFGESKPETPQMSLGRHWEPIALDWYMEKHPGLKFIPAVAENKEAPWQMASLDGFNEFADYHVEVKTTSSWESFSKWKDGDIPEHFNIQLQHQMGLFGYEYCDLVMCLAANTYDTDPVFHYRTIDFDEKLYEEIFETEDAFYHDYILGLEAPPLTSKDVRYRNDDMWAQYADQVADADAKIKELEAIREKGKRALIELAEGMPTEGFGVRVVPVLRQGAIDYKSIPEFKTVDLDQYRKPPVEYWKLSIQS